MKCANEQEPIHKDLLHVGFCKRFTHDVQITPISTFTSFATCAKSMTEIAVERTESIDLDLELESLS